MKVVRTKPKEAQGGCACALGSLLPDLHAFAPGAHVFAQQQVVQGHCTDDVELLLHHLLDELLVGAVLTHGGVEGAELSQDGVQGVGALVSDAGRPLTETSGLHPRHALDGLMLQHARDCRQQTHIFISTCVMSTCMSINKSKLKENRKEQFLLHPKNEH